jgi:hypothetical protein
VKITAVIVMGTGNYHTNITNFLSTNGGKVSSGNFWFNLVPGTDRAGGPAAGGASLRCWRKVSARYDHT